jgi:F-type H+-transporting ATPase subunit b
VSASLFLGAPVVAEEGLPLGINLYSLIAQAVVFTIVLIVLARFAFPVLTKTLASREKVIREGIENTEHSRKELAETQSRIESMLEDARQQAQRSLAQANQAGEQLRTQIEQQAQERARDILAQAEKNTQQAIAQAKTELRGEVADLAILAAERVVGKSMDTATNRQLVQEFVAQSKELQC